MGQFREIPEHPLIDAWEASMELEVMIKTKIDHLIEEHRDSSTEMQVDIQPDEEWLESLRVSIEHL